MKIRKISKILVPFIVVQYIFSQTTFTFNYTGAIQNWVVPAGVCEIKIQAWGAGGGGGGSDCSVNNSNASGGNGGYVEGFFNVSSGDNLTIYVGGGGGGGAFNSPGGNGGWGYGSGGNGGPAANNSASGGGGGGASAVLINGNVSLVAGGGGGGGGAGWASTCTGSADGYGGAGGNSGMNGTTNSIFSGGIGGGAPTPNGTNANNTNWTGGGGGGGGYFGGTAGTSGNNSVNGQGAGGGGGGSNYCNGSGCVILPSNGALGGSGASTNAIPGSPGNNGTVVITITKQSNITSASITSQSVLCNGTATGGATLNLTGGTAPFSYTWVPGNVNASSISNVSAGTYTVYYSDASGCVFSETVNIPQPAPLSVTSIQTKSVTCYNGTDGSATVTVSGGNGPYSYTWLPTGGSNSIATGLGCGTVQPNPSITYTVKISDVNNCTVQATAIINGPPQIMAHVLSYNNVTCNGANDGMVKLLTNGGVGYFPGANLTYTYVFAPTGYSVAANSPTVTNLPPANYTIYVYDANQCYDTIRLNITEPPPLTLTTAVQQTVSCKGGYDGVASATVQGGTPFYTYYWYDASGNIVANQSTANYLPAGNYTVSITDFYNCSITGSVSIIEPASPVSITGVSLQVAQTNCASAPSNTLYINVGGGMGNYTYSSTPAAINSSVNVNVPSNSYTIYVSDINGCTTNTTYVINLPPAFTATAVQVQSVTCNGYTNGAVSVIAQGGTGAYTYTWLPNNNYGQTQYNLAAGVYTVLISDSRPCVISETVQVIEPPPLQIVNLQSNPALCGNANGGATVTASGGMPPYTYTWSSVPIQTNSVAFGLTGGTTYSVFVEDINNCIIWDTIFIPNPLPPLITNISFTPPLCYGNNNGSASVSFVNGVPPISINWQPGNWPGSATIYNVPAGIYTVTLTDANGCQTYTTINVTQPPALSLQVTPTHTICYGTNGTVQAIPDGGTPPYIYTWNPAIFVGGGPHPIPLTQSSQFVVSVTDANGCNIGPDTVKIVVLPPLLASGMSTTICHNDTTRIWASITSPGNGGPYTYTWTNGATTLTTSVIGFYPSQPNTYTVIISDGCSIPDAVAISTVNVNPLPKGYFTSDFREGCPPLKVWFQAISDRNNDTYVWDFGNGETGSGKSITSEYLSTGTYSVKLTITNQYGCVIDTFAANYITVHPVPTADFELDKYETTIFDPTFMCTNLSVGSSQFQWNFGAPDQPNNSTTFANPMHTYVKAGEYDITLVAINDFNCEDRITKKVVVHPDYLLYIPNAFTPDGNGVNDVFQPKGLGILNTPYKMEIYDRWGELVFVSEEFEEGWRGQIKGTMNKAKNDVYVYKIVVKDLSGKEHIYTGHVTLLGNSN